MCGIAGLHSLRQPETFQEEKLRQMLGAIRHRGPDQFGIYRFQDRLSSIGLGHARLSIIDLAGGQQPLDNESGNLWITFNGEIFNYKELRRELQQLGHDFKTQSDTEVIVHLYEQFGVDCLHRLNGQFAFAIWDEQERTLFMARDKVGIRPLFYTVSDNLLLFASEIKAILAVRAEPPELDYTTLDQIFTYWSPLSPRTIFKNIYSLPPGHWMRVQDGHIVIQPYWEPDFTLDQMATRQRLPEAAANLRRLLTQATKLRLRSDVPVGAYLSGGLDSSAITALLYRDLGQKLETFSIAFTDDTFNEAPFQQQMADHLGTRHHVITCTHADVGEAFPQTIWHAEMPILRTSPVPLYLLSEYVRHAGVKVVLTGEGADEFLGGYNIFKEALIRRFWARQPDSVIRPQLLRKLYSYVSNLDNPAYLKKYFSYRLEEINQPGYSHLLRWRNGSRHRRIFQPEVLGEVDKDNLLPKPPIALPANFSRWTALAQAQYLEITIFMAEYLLSAQGDRMAMAHAVEGRFPFLDPNVISFCNLLPPDFKLRGLSEKHILKHAVRDLLPSSIWRRAKRPYRAPIHRSFFPDGRPLAWVAEMLGPNKIAAAGCFQPRAVQALLNKLDRLGTLGEVDDMALAGILSTQLVQHHFIAQPQTAPPINASDNVKIVERGHLALRKSSDNLLGVTR